MVLQHNPRPPTQSVPSSSRSPAAAGRSVTAPIRFLRHPQSDFVVRSRPAQLQCAAVNAQRIRVKCNAKWLDDQRVRQEKGVDAESALPIVSASVEIQRAELDAWLADLGEFACQCWAFPGNRREGTLDEEEEDEEEDDEEEDEEEEEEEGEEDGEEQRGASTSQGGGGEGGQWHNSGPAKAVAVGGAVRSETAKIRLAYLRKHFPQGPIARRVEEGKTVQLHCQPPDGDPRPEVHWHKDGQAVNFAPGGPLIQAADGSLIISAARLADSGNYSCEARNPANRRISEAAQLGVYVDGVWSPWSNWEGACALLACPVLSSELAMVRGDAAAVQRVLPQQRRTRTCNNPAPLNGGTQCTGSVEELRECAHDCRWDGAWAQWTPWARECDADCRRWRNRECTAPSPANGGAPCVGADSQWRNCTTSDDLGLPAPAHCRPDFLQSNASPSLHPKMPSEPSGAVSADLFHSNLYLLTSLGSVAFLLLVIAILCGALCRRSNLKVPKKKRKGDAGGHKISTQCGLFLDKDEKMYFPGTAVAATTEDELGNVRTVLLSAEQKQALLAASSPSADAFCLSNQSTPGGRFFSLKPGGISTNGKFRRNHARLPPWTPQLHPTVSTPTSAAARLTALLHLPSNGTANNYTVRSWNSGGGGTTTGPYATTGLAMANSRRQTKRSGDGAGSQAALLPEYGSSSSSHGSGGSARCFRRPPSSCQRHRCPPAEEEENNYATLYEELSSSIRQETVPLPPSSSGADSLASAEYAMSSSADTRPLPGTGSDGSTRDGPTFVAAKVDGESTRIELRKSGAALTIGEHTFPRAHTLFLSVSDDAAERPSLADGDTSLSPTVAFGFCDHCPSAEFSRPVVLSVDHCASLFPREHCWHFSLHAQLTTDDGTSAEAWQCVWQSDDGGSCSDSQFGVQMERQQWHLLTRRSGKFMLTGRPRRAHAAAQKRVRLCAYWTPPAAPFRRPVAPPADCANAYDPVPIGSAELAQLRVYCVLDIAMGVQNVRQQEEQQLGGLLLAETHNFLLAPKGPLCCCLEQIAFPGGEGHPNGGSQYLEIPDHVHRWCAQNGLHFQLIVSGVPSSAPFPALPRSLSGRIVLYQKGNAADRQVLSFAVDTDDPNLFGKRMGRDDSSLSRLSAFGTDTLISTQFQLTAAIRVKLANVLEQGMPDWRALADKLGLCGHVKVIETELCPALTLLDLWEAIHAGSERALLDLLQHLRVLGRADAVHLLEQCLSDHSFGQLHQRQQQYFMPVPCPPAPFCSLNVSPEESRDELRRACSE
ncbi:hypothetical protein niasHS_012261 [Heterodera schachtii]|uniref:Netrin receptor UNC5 n=1 Tax=Heterodera schachtii TaxID=97005 RepID=A0ABD2II73_HETSC